MHYFGGIVSLDQSVKMRGHESFGEKAGVRFQYCNRKRIEAADQVGFAPEHHFIVGRETDVTGLSHGISFFCFTIHSHCPSAAVNRTDEMLFCEDREFPRRNLAFATKGMKELHDAFRGRESGIFLPNADTKGTDVPQYSFRGQLGELSGAERADAVAGEGRVHPRTLT